MVSLQPCGTAVGGLRCCLKLALRACRQLSASGHASSAIDAELAALVKVTDFRCTPATAIANNSSPGRSTVSRRKPTTRSNEAASAADSNEEEEEVRVVETGDCVAYHSAAVQCTASLELDSLKEAAASDWTIGLVQACHGALIENRYGRAGSAHWLFRPLLLGRAVNDSDGKHYPFYSKYSMIGVAKGERFSRQRVQLSLVDSFHPTVTWRLTCSKDSLTEIVREQSFHVWLVAAPLSAKRLHAMHRDSGANGNGDSDADADADSRRQFRVLAGGPISWRFSLRLAFDCSRPVGSRLASVHRTASVANADSGAAVPRIPPGAVTGATCNDQQALVWQPSDSRLPGQLVLPPRRPPADWDAWLRGLGLGHLVGKVPPPVPVGGNSATSGG